MTEETAPSPSPDGESPPEDDTLGDEVTRVVESAAELGLGAAIAPFTGGETVSIIGSVASMLEAGVDRLTHLGEHESPRPADEEGAGVPPGREPPDAGDEAGEDGEPADAEADAPDASDSAGAEPDTGGQATVGRG